MRTELGESPVAFKVDVIGSRAQITFFENAMQLPSASDEQPRWEADMYTLDVPNRPGLTASVESNYAAWMDVAKAQEEILSPKPLDERVSTLEVCALDAMELQSEMLYQLCLMEMGVNANDL